MAMSPPDRGRRPSGHLSGLARGGSLNLVGSAFGAVFAMVLVLVVTRGFGAATGGAFFEVVAIYNIAVIVVLLGADTGLVRFTSGLLATEGHAGPGRLVKVGLVPVAVFGVVVAGVGWFAAPWLGETLGGGTHTLEVEQMVRTVVWFVPVGAVSLAILGATRGHGTLLPTVLAERIGRPGFQLVAGVVVLAVGGGVGALVRVWTGGIVLAAIVAVWWLVRLRRVDQTEVKSDGAGVKETARSFWAFTLPRAFASMFRVGIVWLDVILVGALISPTAAATYTVATRLLQAGFVAVDAVGQAVEPMFSAAVASGDSDRTRSLYEVSTGWLVSLTWPMFLTVWLFAGSILGLFGDEFSGATSVVAILALSALIGSGVGSVDVLLVMAGKSTWSLWNSAVSFGLNVGLNLLLIPMWGLNGAALAWAVSRAAANILPLIQVRSLLGYYPFGVGWRTSATVSLSVFGLGGLIARAVGGPTALTFAVYAVAAVLAYGLIVFRFRDRLDLGAFSAIIGARFKPRPAEGR